MLPSMITQYIEKKTAGPTIKKVMIIAFLLCMFPPTFVRVPLHNTFLNCKASFTYEQEVLTSYFFFVEVYKDHSFNFLRLGGSRIAATSKMEHFVIIVNGWKPLTIIRKSSILDVVQNAVQHVVQLLHSSTRSACGTLGSDLKTLSFDFI